MMTRQVDSGIKVHLNQTSDQLFEEVVENKANLLFTKDNQVPKFFYDLTPCKRSMIDPSIRSTSPDSFFKKIGQVSPFFTTQTKQNHSPVTPQTWNKITSQIKLARTSIPFELLFQQSEVKQLDNFELKLPGPGINDSDRPFQPEIYWERSKQEVKPSTTPKNDCFGCNCRNSRCLKLYCECLRKRGFCSNCNCVGCENTETSVFRAEKIKFIEKKNPLAFVPNILTKAAEEKMPNQKGCNCRKSNCLKNYCECHQFGMLCGEFCKCKECKNLKEEGKKGFKKFKKTKSA